MADTPNYTLNMGTAIPTRDTGWGPTSFNGTFTGDPNKDGKNKYNVSQMSYPADLHDDMYDGNMVVFYINVANASKFDTNQGGTGSYSMDQLDLPRVRLTTEGIPDTPASLAAAAAATVAVKTAAAGAIYGASKGWSGSSDSSMNFFGNIVDKFKAATWGAFTGSMAGFGVGVAGAAPGSIAIGAAASISGTTKREQKRLRSAIALHMPNNLNIRYSTNWDSTDTVELAMAGAGGEAIAKVFEDYNNSTDVGKSIVANLGLQGGPQSGAASAYTGLAANPRKELVFKGVDFRTFQFDYKFFPRDDIEARNVENIINAFKFHMHPEFKDTNSFLYLYPSEFDIMYYTKNNENTHIHRHTSCVLTDMSINYTPNGNFNVFANGMPTEIDITLTFKELAVMSKELISKGL